MGSRKGKGYASGAATSDPSFKGKNVAGISNPVIDQISLGVSDMHVNLTQDDGWKEYGKKSKNKSNASRQWGTQQPSPKAWGSADTVQKLGLRNDGGLGRGGSSQTGPAVSSDYNQSPKGDEIDDESDGIDDSDDELLSDGFESDESQKSHETRKKNKWFKELFQCLDKLSVEQINEPERQWHCPACRGGPGEIDWYRGLQPLITHAKTKKSKRMKLHRELAELLDEELRIKGASAVLAGEIFGRWKAPDEKADKEIVWPPMVVIMNTRLGKDDNDKWIGMGNQELLDYFREYSADKARHSYGPQGHRGMSMLIFEASAVGYAEAERLSKCFEDNGLDWIAWCRNKVAFQLYGYMAEKYDLESFNQHSQGKSKLKYEMRSYQEMVVKQMKQMSEDNQLLEWSKKQAVKVQRSKKALEDSFGLVSVKLRMTMLENKELKLRTEKHHELIKAEMDSQELFYSEHIQQLYDAGKAKEEKLEKMQSKGKASCAEERGGRIEGIGIQSDKYKEFVMKRDKLMQAYEERRLALEKELDDDLNKLIEEYNLPPSESKQ